MSDILEVNDLKTYFYTPHEIVKAVDGVSFNIRKGEVFGLVGESGSGKTLTALSILRLIRAPAKIAGGSVIFNGVDLLYSDEEYLRSLRGSKISMVFQEPATALNPVFTVGYQVSEAITAHRCMDKTVAARLAVELLEAVHIPDPEKAYHDYPHQLSGGMRQRIVIAMALANSPELLILDEPTTALDVTIQAQILELIEELILKRRVSALFISHDLGIISKMCGRVAVMHKGKIVETGPKEQILKAPKNPYTISLIESVKALA